MESKLSSLKLTIAYDGTSFIGWQKSPFGPSIEETLENAFNCKVMAASRTDAGVHAYGQVISLDGPYCKPNLPLTIQIRKIEEVPSTFHPSLDCTCKEYRYYVCNTATQLPIHRLYSWHCYLPLDLNRMRFASERLVGTHDFAAFCNVKKNEKYTDTVRTVSDFEIEELGDGRLCFKVKGPRFLYKMVRNLVGTVVYIGQGKIALEQLSLLLEKKDRTLLGITAPAHGLFLHEIRY